MSKKYDYNKSDIANIVEEFKALLVEHDCADDVCVYYNNRRTHYVTHLWNKETKKFDDVKAWVDELLEKVNAAIKELKEDGTFDEIISKYITD